MKKQYIQPSVDVVLVNYTTTLLQASTLEGGGDKGDYSGGQLSRRKTFWDSDDE